LIILIQFQLKYMYCHQTNEQKVEIAIPFHFFLFVVITIPFSGGIFILQIKRSPPFSKCVYKNAMCYFACKNYMFFIITKVKLEEILFFNKIYSKVIIAIKKACVSHM